MPPKVTTIKMTNAVEPCRTCGGTARDPHPPERAELPSGLCQAGHHCPECSKLRAQLLALYERRIDLCPACAGSGKHPPADDLEVYERAARFEHSGDDAYAGALRQVLERRDAMNTKGGRA